MAYCYSNLDRNNLKRFANDSTRASLLAIAVRGGNIRGLKDIKIPFEYPITAIAGRNRSGKTTVLALAACAYHNSPDGFRLPGRKYSYYTISDFFIQMSGEPSPSGVTIRNKFFYDDWAITRHNKETVGKFWQRRKKREGGRWPNYDRRVHRTVVYLGFERVVPHMEKSVSISYRKEFQSVESSGWENDTREIVGRILGTDYADFEYKEHSKYRLPVVSSREGQYSGFNMGAGESATFEIISTIMECPEGALIIIDEIELGLHEEAQISLIDELKALCRKRHIQVICTTHSPRILECLPPEGRIFLEKTGDSTAVIVGISPDYATGKLSGRDAIEVDVLVEDGVAEMMIEACLSTEQRSRVEIMDIGSDATVMRHLAVRCKENRAPKVCAILDGDKRSSLDTQIRSFMSALESCDDEDEVKKWAKDRIEFLPGEVRPEEWTLNQLFSNRVMGGNDCNKLSEVFDLPEESFFDVLTAAKRAGKHREFDEVASRLSLRMKEAVVSHHLVRCALESAPKEKERLRNFIDSFLE
jgi:predicted ATPase